MPEPTRGPRGYPDYQRVENWDGPRLIKESEERLPGEKVESALIEVSRYSAIAVPAFCEKGNVNLICTWTNASVKEVIATREFAFSKSIGSKAQLRIPNLGPYMFFTMKFVGGEAGLLTIEVFGTNRQSPESIPGKAILHHVKRKYKASEEQTYNLTEYVSGKVGVAVRSFGGKAITFLLYTIDNEGNNVLLGAIQANSEHSQVYAEVGVPTAPLWALAINTSEGEQEVETTITALP